MRFVIGIAGNLSAFPQFVTAKAGNDLNRGISNSSGLLTIMWNLREYSAAKFPLRICGNWLCRDCDLSGMAGIYSYTTIPL